VRPESKQWPRRQSVLSYARIGHSSITVYDFPTVFVRQSRKRGLASNNIGNHLVRTRVLLLDVRTSTETFYRSETLCVQLPAAIHIAAHATFSCSRKSWSDRLLSVQTVIIRPLVQVVY
jgi:hypothetical protein